MGTELYIETNKRQHFERTREKLLKNKANGTKKRKTTSFVK